MHSRLILVPLIISVVLISGCGGGSGGSTLEPANTGGSVSGTISFGGNDPNATAISISTTISKLSTNRFPVAKMRTSRLSQKSAPNEKIIKFRPGLSNTEMEQAIRAMGGTVKAKIYGTETTYLVKIDTSRFTAIKDENNQYIESIEDNLIMTAFATPNDPGFGYQWNYQMLNLPAAWDQQKGNSNIIVAVVDTGVTLSHPDLAANLVGGYDFVDDDSDPSDNTYYNEDNRYSHGTHVAGIISAVTNNNEGVAGAAWNVKIMPVRVLGPDGLGYFSDIVEGIYWAVNNGANIINLSLGTNGVDAYDSGTEGIRQAIDNAISHNVTVVAAAGNNRSSVAFPANYTPVIAVSALGPSGSFESDYSNYGSEIDFCAPGGKGSTITDPATQVILSTSIDKSAQENDYVYMRGTSMAAPHISGLAALFYSKGYTTPGSVYNRLCYGVIDKGATGKDPYYGYGMPNPYTAPFDLSAVKVLYSLNRIDISAQYSCDKNGYYNITNLPPNLIYVGAFLDKNFDGVVNSGDMYTEFQPVSIQAGVTKTQDLVLQYVPAGTSLSVAEYFKKLSTASQKN
jgi:serine protease